MSILVNLLFSLLIIVGLGLIMRKTGRLPVVFFIFFFILIFLKGTASDEITPLFSYLIDDIMPRLGVIS